VVVRGCGKRAQLVNQQSAVDRCAAPSHSLRDLANRSGSAEDRRSRWLQPCWWARQGLNL
jgi:hypothetical protein